MIKKAVHEDELIYGMQRELQGHNKKQAMANLDKAGNYLQAAMEILESAGLTKQSDAVLEILAKIAARPNSEVMEMPSLAKLFAKGLTPADMRASTDPTHPEHHASKSKIRNILRSLGHEESWIDKFLGGKPKLDSVDVGGLFPQDLPPASSPGAAKPLTGLINQLREEEAIKALPSTTAAEHHHYKPGRPDKVHDPHVSGLTPEKMVENLKHHGIVFNMADDGQANDLLDADVAQPKEFDEDYKKWKAMKEPDTKKERKKMKEIRLEDLDDVNDTIEVTEARPDVHDFEEEIESK